MRLIHRLSVIIRPGPFAGGAVVLLAAWIWPLGKVSPDLFAFHMLQHLLVMNGGALLIALALRPMPLPRFNLVLLTALQLGALGCWHLPVVLVSSHHDLFLQGAMQISLFSIALLFWRELIDVAGHSVWERIIAALITAKFLCLFGAALVFSRRPIYSGFSAHEYWGLTALEDQQLAGLLMMSSCALVYVTAAIAMFAGWLFTTRRHATLAVP